MDDTFAKELLHRLPLAQATLVLWRWLADPPPLEAIFHSHRGRCYRGELAFASLVHLIADALLQHRGSARQSFQRARESGALTVSHVAAYGKLGRLPPAVSEAFLAEGTDRLLSLFPPRGGVPLPPSVQPFAVTVLDGKAVKRVPKRLRPLRQAPGGVLGGKALAALDLASGLVLAMATTPDGDANDASLVPALLPQVRARRQAILWVADRQFCDLTQPPAFAARQGDHFLVRYHPRTTFGPDPAVPGRTGQDRCGRTYGEDWGWLGAAGNPGRRYVRRITLHRPGAEAIILITDLLDAARYPAGELLALYHMRWGIERVFQQITEVFALEHLIGTTPQGTLFQLAFCLVLYNLIQVVRAYVAEGARQESSAVSAELLFEDVRRQLIAWHEALRPEEVVGLIPGAWTAATMREQLQGLLGNAWTERWRKAPAKKRKRPEARERTQSHGSAYRILREDRLARKQGPRTERRP
jgi:hypothetical protein